jgi:hypothetical protein
MPCEEISDALRFGCLEYKLRRALLKDQAIVQETNFISDMIGKANLMRNANHGHAIFS